MFSKHENPRSSTESSISSNDVPISHPSGAIPKQHRVLARTGHSGRDSPHPRPHRPQASPSESPSPTEELVLQRRILRHRDHTRRPIPVQTPTAPDFEDSSSSVKAAVSPEHIEMLSILPAGTGKKSLNSRSKESSLDSYSEVWPARQTRASTLPRHLLSSTSNHDLATDNTSCETQCWPQLLELLRQLTSRVGSWISKQTRRFWNRTPPTMQSEEQNATEDFKDQQQGYITLYLNEHPEFLEEYVAKQINLETLEEMYQQKFEQELMKPFNNRVRKLQNMDNTRYEFNKALAALSSEPPQQEIIEDLAPALRKVLRGNVHRIFKVNRENMDFVEVVAINKDHINNRILERFTLNECLPGIQIMEALRRETCVYLTKHNDPLDVSINPSTLFQDKNNRQAILRHVICVPVLEFNGEVKFAIEVWRSTPFTMQDVDIAGNLITWGCISIYFSSMVRVAVLQSNLTDFLLETVKAIFEEMSSLDRVIMRILMFAQRLVNADRASLFLIDYKNGELVSNVFDMQWDDNGSTNKKEIRMPLGKGIAGHVAVTGKSLNIVDAYSDRRFNRSVDRTTGYITKSILCLPIKIQGKVIGVVQMVNKRSGSKFVTKDECSFNLFSSFFGLALHHARLYDKITRKEQKYRVALEVLSYHNTCRDTEVMELISLYPPQPPLVLGDFHLDPFELSHLQKCQAATTMFNDLFTMNKFDKMNLVRFILTVKKNYRDVPYHNFDHGWSVAQAMYAILKRDELGRFSYKQRLALFVASLCHDLDHRGYTNKYMSETASPLAAMYTTSTLEHHHFNITVTILQQEEHNIFSHFSSKEYKEILSLIKICILSTDLASFFPNLKKLQQLHDVNNPTFHWENQEHKELAMAISMTAADLSAASKPFDIQNRTVKVIFEEFYDQGDKERAAGRQPIPMMDRNQPQEQPASQVEFINQICLPCYGMLHTLIPDTKPMYISAQNNLTIWEEQAAVVAIQKTRLEQDIVSESTFPIDQPITSATSEPEHKSEFIEESHNQYHDADTSINCKSPLGASPEQTSSEKI